MRYEDLHALVMQVRPYRESSALVSVFSLEAGRFTMVVRGVRNRKRTVLVQPFVQARISCFGKGTLLTNSKYEVTGQFHLTGNQLSAGFYVLEILRRSLAEFQIEQDIYRMVLDCLTRLAHLDVADTHTVGQCLRPFELNLLQALGYGLDLAHDALSGEPLDPDRHYQLQTELGVVETPTVEQTETTYSGRVLLDIAARDFNRVETLNAAQRITHLLLPALIGHAPLVSRSLWST